MKRQDISHQKNGGNHKQRQQSNLYLQSPTSQLKDSQRTQHAEKIKKEKRKHYMDLLCNFVKFCARAQYKQ